MKTIVITGSTRGIGRGLATEFLKPGCNVLQNTKNGARFNRLSPGKIAFRFLTARFRSRDIFSA